MDIRRYGRTLPAMTVLTGLALFAPMGVQAAAQDAPAEPVAGAHGASPDTSVDFSKLDTNTNGSIDKKEAQAAEIIGSNFEQLDQNRDQQLDRAEFAAFDQQRMRVKRLGPPAKEVDAHGLHEPAETEPTESWFTLPQHQPDEKSSKQQ